MTPPCETAECAREQFAALSEQARGLERISILGGMREAQADELYVELNDLVHRMQDLAVGLRGEVLEQRERIATLRSEAMSRREEADSRTPGVEGELGRLVVALATTQKKHDDLLVLLTKAQTLRRTLRSETSAETSAREREMLGKDLRTELSLIEPSVRALLRHRLRLLQTLPSRWNDWHLLQTLFSGLLRAALVAVFWWIARRRLPRMLPTLIRLRWRRSGNESLPRDLWGLDPVLRRAGVAAIDLTACIVLMPLLRGSLPELGLLVLIYAQLAIYRLGMSLTSLAIAEHPQVRPALKTLRPTTRILALRTVRVLLIWGIVRGFTTYVALHLLAAVVLEDILRIFFRIILVFLLLWILHFWEKPLREMLLRHYPGNRFLQRLSGPSLSFVRAVRTPFLVAIWSVLSVRERVRQRGGWIAGILQERDAEQPTGMPSVLSEEVIKALLMRDCDGDEYIEREESREAFLKNLERWDHEKRRGVITVVGDEGSGKHVFLQRRIEELEAAGREVIRLRVRERMTSAEEMSAWLASSLALENPPESPAELGARLNEHLAGKIVILEALHLAFLRRVGGFNAMRVLLRVLGAAGGRVFWVLSMHRPAWLYLSSTGLLDTGLCEPVLHLEGLPQDKLSRLVLSRMASIGHQVSFSPLAPYRPPGNTSYTLERAREEYFRRLAWASRGNPAVALRLWRETLRIPVAAAPGMLEVERFCYLRRLPDLRDADLFVLAAIQTHRAISRDELVEVTNMGPGIVQAALSKLEGHRLLVPRARRYSIEPLYLPAVTADLRRRHILYDKS